MSSSSIGEALRDEAHRKLMSRFMLKDWQLEDPTTSPDAIVEPERPMTVEVEEFRINIYTGDVPKLTVWIELKDSELIVHTYDNQHDEPVSLRISDDKIDIEMR